MQRVKTLDSDKESLLCCCSTDKLMSKQMFECLEENHTEYRQKRKENLNLKCPLPIWCCKHC